MSNVNKKLESFFDSSLLHVEKKIDDTIDDITIKDILKGGKRLRSLLAHLAFKTCTEGKETEEQFNRALEGTVSIELAHGASLVHDDIIDKDIERRGKPAFHVKEGIGKALLIGHRMLTKGFDIALSHGHEVAKLYVESWEEVVNGEIDEVDFNKNGNSKANLSKEEIFASYNKIIDLKTAALFASACKAGVLEANMSGDVVKVFGDYGREIGLAYQLADDLVDLVQGEILDSVVIPLLNQLKGTKQKLGFFKKREIKKLFEENKGEIKDFYVSEIKKHLNRAKELSNSEQIPKSEYKTLLNEAPSYIINRMLAEIKMTI